MKVKKTLTEKVIAANRENSKKATGPNNTEYSSQNAVVHGVLSRKLRFKDEEERLLYDGLVGELCADHCPSGASEYALVFELAFCTWNLQKLYAWLFDEMTIADDSAKAILNNVAENYDSEQVPVFAAGRANAATRGWECQELLVQTASRTCEQERGLGTEEMNKKSGRVLVHTKMTRTVDLILRYTAAVKRDYYRALSKLQELQREKCELQLLSAGYKGDKNEKES